MRTNLMEVHLGHWAYDDLIIYISEICKSLENIEINSDKVTDLSVTQILRKCAFLRFLDVSGCDNFMGTAFSDAVQAQEGQTSGLASDRIREITLGESFCSGHNMKSVQERVHAVQPNVIFKLNKEKGYSKYVKELAR
jgi:hypothetical protein